MKKRTLLAIGAITVLLLTGCQSSSSNAETEALKEQVQKDPVKTTVVDMTLLNLVEITRKKVRRPLLEQAAGLLRPPIVKNSKQTDQDNID